MEKGPIQKTGKGRGTPSNRKGTIKPLQPVSPVAIKDSVQSIKDHMARISGTVIGMDDIIEQAFYAVITGEHMLLLGRTGMAKSYLARSIFNTFSGAALFSSQASKDQTPDNYFGPYDIGKFKKGIIRHNVKGSVTDAEFVFLDEFFDANDMVLRSLLSVLNERMFINGAEQVPCRVHTAVATANYMRLNEVTEAVLDRFIFKSIIPEREDLYSRLLIDHTYAMGGGLAPVPERPIPFEQLLPIHAIIRNRNLHAVVDVPDHVYYMKNAVLGRYAGAMKLKDRDFFISPRRAARLSDILRASALMDGRPHAGTGDIRALHLGACTLNYHPSGSGTGPTEKEIFLDAFSRTMTHFDATGALEQVRLLLDIRRVMKEMASGTFKRDPGKRESGLLNGIRELLRKFIKSKRSDDEEITPQTLRRDLMEITPAIEEVRDLRDGILKEFSGLR